MTELDPLLRRPEVERATSLSRSSIYDRMRSGTFPRPVRLGPQSVAWRRSDIIAWLSQQEAA